MAANQFKIYLDQMFSEEVAKALRSEGHYALRAIEIGQSRADDSQILQKAIDKGLILVTLDDHFGDWVILPLYRHPGVIRLKVNPTTSENINKLLVPFLRKHSPGQFKDQLVILSDTRGKWIFTDKDKQS